MFEKWIKVNWKRTFVVILCLLLIAAHSIWPQLRFDAINIWLGTIAVVLFLVPDVNFLLPYLRRIKRFRAAGLEVELIDLEEKVEKAEAETLGSEIPLNVSPEVDEVLREASKDPRAALLLLSSKIDTTVKKRFEEAGLDIRYGAAIVRFPPTHQAIAKGIDLGLFPPTALSAYNDFREIRNKIAHDYAFQVANATILSLISLGSELLKLLSAEKPSVSVGR